MPSSITVVEQIYFRDEKGSVGKCFEPGFTRQLTTEEQPWGPRTISVGDTWQALDLGWFEETGNIGMIILTNESGKFTQRVPTEKVRSEELAKVIEVNFSGNTSSYPIADIYIPAKESARLTPANAKMINLRCRKGVGRCSITILPV